MKKISATAAPVSNRRRNSPPNSAYAMTPITTEMTMIAAQLRDAPACRNELNRMASRSLRMTPIQNTGSEKNRNTITVTV